MKLFYNKVSETMKGRVHPRVKPNGKDTTMNKILIAGCTLLTAFAAVAMPNKKELAKAQRLVDDVTSADLKALKAGTTTAKEVAGTHMQLAGKAESQAEKYLLYQGAFKLYARSEEYDLAADALRALNNEVKDVPPEVIVEVVGKEMRRVAGKKAPRVLTIFKQAKRSAKYRKEIAGVEKALKAKPHDTELNRKYGECLAELERWDEAIMAFAKSAGEVAKIAAGEANGTLAFQQCADFWWSYGKDDEDDTYKVHAASLYQKALDSGALTGLSQKQANNRIAEALGDNVTMVGSRSFDLKDGTKIEMIGCPASEGPVELGIVDAAVLSGPYKFRITRPFWMMKANLSLQQLLACGIETHLKDARWAPSLKAHPEIWDRYCGDIGLNQVEIVCKVLNSKYKDVIPKGYVFRLPTLAEWMYARQSGSRDMKDPYTNWQVLSEEERKQYFPAVFTTMIEFSKIHGSLPGGMPSDRKHKNKWGFMDMWTFHTPLLDRVSETDGAEVVSKKERTSTDVVSINYLQGNDPFSFVNGENFRRLNISGCISGHDFLQISEAGEKSWGYRSARIVLGPDLEKEWNDKHKNQK